MGSTGKALTDLGARGTGSREDPEGFFRRRWDIWNETDKRWKDEEEGAKEAGLDDGLLRYHYLPFDRCALFVYRLGFWSAPSWWVIDTSKRFRLRPAETNPQTRFEQAVEEERCTAWYVFIWFLVLVGLWAAAPSGAPAAIAGGLALWRLLEIVITVLGFVLNQREPKIARSLITIGLLALQLALIFAIVDHSFAGADFLKPAMLASHSSQHATSPFEYLYLNWTYMTTLGNQYVAKTEFAQALQLAANTSGILLLGIVAARAIGLTLETKQRASELESRIQGLKSSPGDGAGTPA